MSVTQQNRRIIERLPLFDGLSDAQLEGLAGIVVDRRVDKGQMIFFESSPAEGFYVVAEGRVKIFKTAPDGREAVMHVMGPGETFGEVAVFQGGTFPAHAMAVENARVLFLPRKGLVDRITRDPTLAMNMLAALSRKLRVFTTKVESLTLHETPQRLAAYLLHASELKGDADTFRLDMAKGVLAGMLGTARETLSRCLGKLAERGAVSVDGREVTIVDRDYLQALADGDETL